MKILIVDDDDIMLQLVAHQLRNLGEYNVIATTNGKNAIKLAEKHQPDMIITDLLMPIASGSELVEYVRETLKLNTFIIVVSAIGLDNVRKEALEMGANRFMTKPFDLKQLMACIQEVNALSQAS
ncbi:response regulator [Catalinimonas niigatensis]|uniref:response regulator n=1 Tax=Catalinimonas niigatensis TaxID=1397264 RepID=UPI002665F7E1|nr:response regulator [Catalinimonas niigatensis]WPP48246.1 response regulator [Catalinimonas niigatensis]